MCSLIQFNDTNILLLSLNNDHTLYSSQYNFTLPNKLLTSATKCPYQTFSLAGQNQSDVIFGLWRFCTMFEISEVLRTFCSNSQWHITGRPHQSGGKLIFIQVILYNWTELIEHLASNHRNFFHFRLKYKTSAVQYCSQPPHLYKHLRNKALYEPFVGDPISVSHLSVSHCRY